MIRPGLALLAVLTLLSGCTSAVIELRDDRDLYRSSFHEKLTAGSSEADEFFACTQRAHDGDPLPLSATPDGAQTALVARLQAPVSALLQRLHERTGTKLGDVPLLADMTADFGDPARRRIDVEKLRHVTEAVRHWHGHLDLDEEALKRDASLFTRLLAAYQKAYFGDISFAITPDAEAGAVRGVVQVVSRGFVDRSGNVLRFPGFSTSVQIDAARQVDLFASAVDSRRLSADLTRLFFEAFFDAAYRVPAVRTATALQTSLEPAPYPAFDPAHPPIALDDLATVTRAALRAEAIVTSAVGKAVRGGGLFGTNNETVAATLETAAGVFAKKLVEHEGFCYFQVTRRLSAPTR
ncbi:MAG: hypothetical protein U0412_08375 [Nitrospira sp.]